MVTKQYNVTFDIIVDAKNEEEVNRMIDHAMNDILDHSNVLSDICVRQVIMQ